MLKYVNPDFQISDLKQVIWLSLHATVKQKQLSFQEIDCREQR